MRLLVAGLTALVVGATIAEAADPLAEARRLYNQGELDTAAGYAREALKTPGTTENARLVLGRIHLERYRRTADSEDLTRAREALRAIDPAALGTSERAELTVGIGQTLFLEDKFGSASESFERALDSAAVLGPIAHDRVLDWWATSLDRLALTRPRDAREPFYRRIVDRMEKELTRDPASAPATYWLVAALRGAGSLDRAWYAAAAGWVNAMLGRDRGAALRADLDRLVLQAIIPERAARLQPRDTKTAAASMTAEWEALKASWTR
jgi:hypothetical protein